MCPLVIIIESQYNTKSPVLKHFAATDLSPAKVSRLSIFLFFYLATAY